ncbi:MAG: SBBP repeat-containing protein, partial [Actinomycetota bacterium]|nr:SBBP repeat-containing protein [Actinomycetota bacterium]
MVVPAVITGATRRGGTAVARRVLLTVGAMAIAAVAVPVAPRLVTRSITPASPAAHPPKPATAAPYANLPLRFVENVGQSDPQVRFQAQAGKSSLFLTGSQAVLSMGNGDALRWGLAGANADATMVGLDPGQGVVNVYDGVTNASHVGIHTYAKVAQRSVYPGVDVVYYGTAGQLEYDMVVAPHADPAPIALNFDGATSRIDDNGDILVQLAGGEVRHRKPDAYQDGPTGRRPVDAHYVLDGTNVRVALGAYDATRPLVIDPLIYSTYLGGNSEDIPESLAVDSNGNAIVAGRTASNNFPQKNGIPGAVYTSYDDSYVTKFNAAGTDIIYSTIFRSDPGNYGEDNAYGVAIDSGGNAYVVGSTGRPFPSTPGAAQSCAFQGVDDYDLQAYIAKMSPSGALLYSTCLGGTLDEVAYGVAVDGAGSAYVTGYTTSPDFPTVNPLPSGATQPDTHGAADAFVTKVNPTGTGFVYSTYLGGNTSDHGEGIAVDASGSAYVVGTTRSNDFPTAAAFDNTLKGGQDLFLSKLSPNGSALMYSTFVGGTGTEGALDRHIPIGVDAAGNAYVASSTNSTDFPTAGTPLQAVSAGGVDAVAFKMNPQGSALSWSTYLGSNGDDGVAQLGLAVESSGVVDLGVPISSSSTNFPVGRSDPIQPSLPVGSGKVVIAKVNPAGSALLSSTYFGTGAEAGPVSVATDSSGAVYVASNTSSQSFPTTPGVYQPVFAPGTTGIQSDTFVAKIDPVVGFLRVTTNPSLPSQITVDGVLRSTYGSINLEAAPGAHQICFREVEGYTGPGCQSVNVVKGATTQVPGNFVGKGFLRVVTSPATPAKISVDGVARDDWGIFTDLATGGHQVCFGPVAGLAPPPCQNVSLTARTTSTVTGTYT